MDKETLDKEKTSQKLSVITVNYNNAKGLRQTIESVAAQTFHNYEYIIIDGGSTDGSVDVINKYADKITYWVSEKDRGIYHAMNKGVTAAHGEYTQFLNSGDYYVNSHVLSDVCNFLTGTDIITGNTIMGGKKIFPSPERVTFELFLNGSLSHPASFIRRDLLIRHPYDERFRISADREFFMHTLVFDNATYKKMDINIADFDLSGISCTTKDSKELNLLHQIINEHIPKRVMEDYNCFMGEEDNYHKLFYTISHSTMRNFIYTFVVCLMKIIFLNRGWIKNYKIKHP